MADYKQTLIEEVKQLSHQKVIDEKLEKALLVMVEYPVNKDYKIALDIWLRLFTHINLSALDMSIKFPLLKGQFADKFKNIRKNYDLINDILNNAENAHLEAIAAAKKAQQRAAESQSNDFGTTAVVAPQHGAFSKEELLDDFFRELTFTIYSDDLDESNKKDVWLLVDEAQRNGVINDAQSDFLAEFLVPPLLLGELEFLNSNEPRNIALRDNAFKDAPEFANHIEKIKEFLENKVGKRDITEICKELAKGRWVVGSYQMAFKVSNGDGTEPFSKSSDSKYRGAEWAVETERKKIGHPETVSKQFPMFDKYRDDVYHEFIQKTCVVLEKGDGALGILYSWGSCHNEGSQERGRWGYHYFHIIGNYGDLVKVVDSFRESPQCLSEFVKVVFGWGDKSSISLNEEDQVDLFRFMKLLVIKTEEKGIEEIPVESAGTLQTARFQPTAPLAEQGFYDKAVQSYQLMLQGQEPLIKPVNLRINKATYDGAEFSPKIFKFEETRGTAAPFIAFVEQNGFDGLLFPNPRINYMPSMDDVFRDLNQHNWQTVKPNITPLKILKKPDFWELAEEEDFAKLAQRSYILMLDGKKPLIKPIFLDLNLENTYKGKTNFEKLSYCFNEEEYDLLAAFIGFVGQDGKDGLLFPAFAILLLPTMSIIFKEMNENNWETIRRTIVPKKIVKLGDKLWELSQEKDFAGLAKRETPEEMWERKRNELRPPMRQFTLEELYYTPEKGRLWKICGPGNIAYAVPYPSENPKSFYLVPLLASSQETPISRRFDKFYSGMAEGYWHEYIIEKPCWMAAEVLERANFDIDFVEATWEALGEMGGVKRVKKAPVGSIEGSLGKPRSGAASQQAAPPDLITMVLFRPETHGNKVESVKVATIEGYIKDRENFRVKKIEVKERIARVRINEIANRTGLSAEVRKVVYVNDDPLSVHITLDYGNLLPVIKRRFYGYTTDGVLHLNDGQEWHDDAVPKGVKLEARKVEFDDNSHMLTIDAYAPAGSNEQP